MTLDGSLLSVADVVAVASVMAPVKLGLAAVRAMKRSRAVVDASLTDGEAHYGINTGFGSLSRQRIAAADLRALQRNLIRSHAAGIGEPLPEPVVRGMMLLLAASLARGISGVRPEVAELLIGLLNAGVTPVVPEVGSVGASGDLAPLAHVGLVLIGEGEATVGGVVMAGAAALAKAGLRPIELAAKEGLAIINGTHLMAARAAMNVAAMRDVFAAALIAAAMSIDACRGTDSYLDPRVHVARCQPGQSMVAERLRRLLERSEVIPSHVENDPRVQDPYSLRCTPQVLGAAWDAMEYVATAVERELGAVTDNPLVFSEVQRDVRAVGATGGRFGAVHGSIVSAGNFHGMPMAIPQDVMAIAAAHVAGISERRTFWMLSAFDPESHLKPYLAAGQPGLNSGLMIAQYTAAACVNEIITLTTPASVSNVPTSAGMEDYNSFGPRSAAKAARAIELARSVVAIELLCAAEGLEYHRPLKSGVRVEAAHRMIRDRVGRLVTDRPPGPDISAIARLIEGGELRPLVES